MIFNFPFRYRLFVSKILVIPKKFVSLHPKFQTYKMPSIVLDVTDESLLSQIKKACSLLKGVSSVKVVKSKDITKTKGYREAMDDIKNGRVYSADSAEDMFKQILG